MRMRSLSSAPPERLRFVHGDDGDGRKCSCQVLRISSVSEDFCARRSRRRLTTGGRLRILLCSGAEQDGAKHGGDVLPARHFLRYTQLNSTRYHPARCC